MLLIPSHSPSFFFGGCFCSIQPCPHITFLWTALPTWVGYWEFAGFGKKANGLPISERLQVVLNGWLKSVPETLWLLSLPGGLHQTWLYNHTSDSWAETYLWTNCSEEKVTKPKWLTGKWILQRQGCFGSLLTHLTPATVMQLSVQSAMQLVA